MDHTQALENLTEVFRTVLDQPTLVLHDAMTAADVENWDSLNHIDLIVAIEKKHNHTVRSEMVERKTR
jgi:acyl carrier protein